VEYHGEVSLVLYGILKDYYKFCKSLPDDDIAKTMKLLGNSIFVKKKIKV
jgi:diaminopropionate ammonia-lyase